MKSNIEPFILISLCLFFFTYSCGPDCYFYKEEFRKLEYDFKISNKYKEGISLVLEGKNKSGKKERFQQAAFYKLQKYAEVNDLIKKDSGSIELFLIKKDTTIKEMWLCHGEIQDSIN